MDTSIVKRDSWHKYDALIKLWSDEYDVPWQWVKAILAQESTLGENALVKAGKASSDGKSWGLAQLRPETATWLLRRPQDNPVTPEELLDDSFSIQLCAKYISFLCAQFDHDEEKVIMSYNQGQGNTAKGRKDMPYYLSWSRWHELVYENP